MPLTRTPKGLDSARTKSRDLSIEIRELKELIAHGKSYTNKDYGSLELRLQELIRQQSGESK